MSIEEIIEVFSSSIISAKPQLDQIRAGLGRLTRKKLLLLLDSRYSCSIEAYEEITGKTITIDEQTKSLLDDIVENVCSISEHRISKDERGRIFNNARQVLIRLFQLFGIEISNQIIKDSIPSPVYFDATDELVFLAKENLPNHIGELLISVISDTLNNPSKEQAILLQKWSLAYIGVTIMNYDPILTEFQKSNLKSKIFILDTDFILDSITVHNPVYKTNYRLINTLIDLGCKVVLPESSLEECILHAEIAPNTYNVFKENLFSLNDSLIDRLVGNVFVKDYYYAYSNDEISNSTSFSDHLKNYYEEKSPYIFFLDVLKSHLPEGFQVIKITDLLNEELPASEINTMTEVLYDLMSWSKKSEFRTDDQQKKLAETDARFFLTALHVNGEYADSSNKIFGGKCFLITSSSKYLKSSKRIGIRDVITTRPHSIISLLELIGVFDSDPLEFARLFENPLLIYAVDMCSEDIKELLKCGISMHGKNIARLRYDLHSGIRDSLIELSRIESSISDEDLESDDEIEGTDAYISLLKKSISLGYKISPIIENMVTEQKIKEDEIATKDLRIKELEFIIDNISDEINKFGKRKQRYLKKMLRDKK